MSFDFIHEPGDPTLVLLHGTGGNEHQMLEFGRQLSSKTGYLSIRGKEPEGRVNRWFRRFEEGVFDEENLRYRAEELSEFVIGALPSTRRIAVGFSNGANIAAAILLLRPEVLDGGVLLAPMVPLQPETLPNLTGKPILMVCGENDPMVPRFNAMSLATMFETAGAVVDLHWHPGGHGLGSQEMRIAAAWIAAQRNEQGSPG